MLFLLYVLTINFKFFNNIVPTPDIYITSSFDDPAVIGSSAFLTCNITAQDIHKSSFALLQWEREGHSIKNETLLPLRETKKLFSFKFDHISKLLISDIKLSNAGLYSCSAQLVKSNATPLLLSSETKTITMMLDVGGKPSLQLLSLIIVKIKCICIIIKMYLGDKSRSLGGGDLGV